jgi:hypothetical protein
LTTYGQHWERMLSRLRSSHFGLSVVAPMDFPTLQVPRRPLEEMVRERARVLATQLAREVADSVAAAVDRGAGISPTGPTPQWPVATRTEGDEPQAQC